MLKLLLISYQVDVISRAKMKLVSIIRAYNKTILHPKKCPFLERWIVPNQKTWTQ
jgi:hypothetical protein